MSQSQHYTLAIDEKLAIHSIGVARRDSIPAVRKPAAIQVIGHLRRHVKRANEITHRADVWNRGNLCSCHKNPANSATPIRTSLHDLTSSRPPPLSSPSG